MSGDIQLVPVSGLILGGSTGSHAVELSLLCGIANGSVVVPITVSGNGVVLTSV